MYFWLCVINTTIIFSAKLLRADRVFATLVKVLKNCMELEDEPDACERGGCRAHPNGSPNGVRVHLEASCDPSDHPRTRALARSGPELSSGLKKRVFIYKYLWNRRQPRNG